MPTPPPHNSTSTPPDCDPHRDDEPRDGDPRSDGDRNPFDDNNDHVPLPPNPMLVLANTICSLADITCHNLTSEPSQCTKVWEPDTFDSTNTHKLCAFIVQCELNFQDCPHTFHIDHAKVTFTHSYLKGMALEWFKPDLLHMEDLDLCPLCMDDYCKFLLELQTNFSLHDPTADAKHQLDNLSMKDGQHINKYVMELLDHIKDEIAHVGKPAMLTTLCTLLQGINACYWEHKSKITHQAK
ncbi:hypothetical protein PAXRUDRAFT_132282, partial [Paxillus rubicundulus Ve08.2h10]